MVSKNIFFKFIISISLLSGAKSVVIIINTSHCFSLLNNINFFVSVICCLVLNILYSLICFIYYLLNDVSIFFYFITFRPLKHLIHQVKLLYNNKLRYCSTETMTDKFHSNRIQTYRFELLDVPCAQKVLTQKQQNDMYLWKITQHKYLNPIENLPGYDCEY